jgi:AcrR family transcriptional regulator
MARLGRPRSFDRQQALCQAERVCWRLGYEGTTLTDLQDAMGGITPPSFYAAFGSKEQLFKEVVEHYRNTEGMSVLRALTESPTARASIEGLLRAAADSFSQPGKPKGCLLFSAMNSAQASRDVEDHLRDLRLRRHKYIRQRLDRGVADGDLPEGVDVDKLASFYTAVLDGLGIQARDGASRKALQSIVSCAMASWNTLVKRRPRKR